MASKFGTWWEKIRSGLGRVWMRTQYHPFITMGIFVLLIAFVAFALAVYWLGWDWTGFNGYSPPTPQYQRGKTLWDWLQLLVIPLILAIGGFWLNQLQKSRDERATEQRDKAEREAAEQRAKVERGIVEDNQREAALQAYLDNMSELLLEKQLRDSAEADEVRKIARVRTLTVLRGLDPIRKASVLRFLYESGLVDTNKRIIDLSEADLSGVNLNEADLRDADLSKAKFRGAQVSRVNLRRANLSGTGLIIANLNGADLSGADLSGANLGYASLKGANLKGADLEGANLTHANLKCAAGITTQELEKQAKSLEGATMPDESRHS